MEMPAQAQPRTPDTAWSLDTAVPAPIGHVPDEPAGNNTVIVRLPASSAYLSILRTATAGLAALLQFTLDEIEDLRIAVDEACAVLLASHPAAPTTRVGEPLASDTELTCQFTLHPRHIDVEVSLPLAADPSRTPPSQHSFAWQVLNALTDEVTTHIDGTMLAISLTKYRAAP